MSTPLMLIAGPRESGARCGHCQIAVSEGQPVAVCPSCGTVHHQACWQQHDGRCGSFHCAPARRAIAGSEPVLKISASQLDRAVPLAAGWAGAGPVLPSGTGRARTSVLARIAAAVAVFSGLALLAAVVARPDRPAIQVLVALGILSGVAALILGCIALSGMQHGRVRGTAWAAWSVLLGLGSMVGWVGLLASAVAPPAAPDVRLEQFEPDAEAMQNLAPHVQRAFRANVLIESQGHGLLSATGIGAGVVMRVEEQSVLVVTNRHVVDPGFPAEEHAAGDASTQRPLSVKLFGQVPQPGTVVWRAPDGIDLALVRVPRLDPQAEAAPWQPNRRLVVGEDVFSIGNPQHLDWSHTRGSISQVRSQVRGARRIRVIQTDAAINPGNSGGGLYDRDGVLIGINTWTGDRRVSEGISFAIALDSLLALDPVPLRGALAAPAPVEKTDGRLP